ncbi:crossover junction endodeoxyribonuclease RuvC (plasmid) [Paenibacillus sp. S-38]|uniref:crossover junction endodeoxyribonuclease RuvC n=1 Tax=Paenibacillus sp. S-38 TaxID=3416710 RepID=UPI003CF53931
MNSQPSVRYLGLDLSLGSPGYAVIDLIDNIPHLVTAGNFKTKPKHSLALRYADIEDQFTSLVDTYKPIHEIVREQFVSRIPDTQRRVFGAWASADRALGRHGYITEKQEHEVSPSKLKSKVGGHGKAEKDEVAAGVRRLLRLPDDYLFSSSDASDACAVVLTHLIEKGVLPSCQTSSPSRSSRRVRSK